MNPMNATKWKFKNFLFPFIAHAIGTLTGAFIAAKFSASYHMVLAVCIGIFFSSRRYLYGIYYACSCMVYCSRPFFGLYTYGWVWLENKWPK